MSVLRSSILGVLIGLIAAVSYPTQVRAQCMGCASSHSCDTSSTRGGCVASCHQNKCSCTDEDCQISQGASIFEQRGTTYVGPGRAVAVGAQTYVITTCQGEVRGVTYTRLRARKVEAAMATVALRPVNEGRHPTATAAIKRFQSAGYVRFSLGSE